MSFRWQSVLISIDTQFDFMDPQGALYVPGAELIVPNLRRLIAAAQARGIPLLSTADYHTPDDPEFANFAPHCVRDTPGQLHLPVTLLPDRAILNPDERVNNMTELLNHHSQVIFRKQTIDIWTSTATQQVLTEIRAEVWYVFGVATDYCVKSAALGLARTGQRTYVVADAIRAITAEGERQSIAEMEAAGVQFVKTDDVLKTLHETRAVHTTEAPFDDTQGRSQHREIKG